jgi:hypothetical protein
VVCDGCGECQEFVGVGTQLDLVLEEAEGREPATPWPVDPAGTIRVRWFERPLAVVGALVRGEDGSPSRIHGVPHQGATVLLWFAATDDGLEVAITQEDLARAGAC